MNKRIYLIILMVACKLCNAQTPNWDWAKHAGGLDEDEGAAVSTDSMGNSYVTGHFTGTATFGTYTITSNGYGDVFTAKYDSAGNVIWVQKGGGSDWDLGEGICIDKKGHVYVTGYFRDTAIFGNDTLFSSGMTDIFIARYDTSGNLIWVQKAGGTLDDAGDAITVDYSGNCYVTGSCYDGSIFGTDTVSCKAATDVFIAKYDSSGNELWVKTGGGDNYDFGFAIATDNFDNCYVTGYFLFKAYFGNDSVSGGYENMFVAKYDSSGNFLWVRSGGGSSFDVGTAVISDEIGNCYVAGSFEFTGYFDTITITSQGVDVFLAKYDSAGNILWVEPAGGTGPDYSSGFARDANGNLFLSGFFQSDTATFGSVTVANNNVGGSTFDVFVTKFDSLGNFKWVKDGGGPYVEFTGNISVDGKGNCYITGNFDSTTVFDTTSLIGYGNTDIFLAKLNSDGITTVPLLSSEEAIQVFPNPFTDNLNVSINENDPSEIILYDITSRKLLQQTFTSSITLNTARLAKGIYLYEVRNKNGVVKKGKVVKE